MSRVRVNSSPDLLPLSNPTSTDDPLSLDGMATNVKLLLKLVQDHQEASHRGNMDERKVQRLAGMMTIIDDVKTRIQRSQNSNKKKSQLRRCNTDLRGNNLPMDPQKKSESMSLDDKEKLKRDLTASYAAQKRLGVMCASLGREKEIISRELMRKVQEMNEMEEHLNDLREQNVKLSSKIQACVAEHRRDKELSDQMKEGRDHGMGGMLATRKDVGEEIEFGIRQTESLKQHIYGCGLGQRMGEIEEIPALEDVFRRLGSMVSRYTQEG